MSYIFVRTKLSLNNEEPLLRELAKNYPYFSERSELHPKQFVNDPVCVPVVGFGRDETSWDNGFIFKYDGRFSPHQLADHMKELFRQFDSWAIVDSEGRFIEHPIGGPMSTFFGRPYRSHGFSQIYILSRRQENDQTSAIEYVRNSHSAYSFPVFHFAGGKVIFFNTAEPATITVRRCNKALSRLDSWAVTDCTGRSISGPIDYDIWRPTMLADLVYE